MSNWPAEVLAFESFLRVKGLTCRRSDQPMPFGDREVQCESDDVAVRMSSDRGIWSVDVSPASDARREWIDAALIRDLVSGPGPDVLSIAEQVAFVRDHWDQVVGVLAGELRQRTQARIAVLRQERMKRRFPGMRIEGQ